MSPPPVPSRKEPGASVKVAKTGREDGGWPERTGSGSGVRTATGVAAVETCDDSSCFREPASLSLFGDSGGRSTGLSGATPSVRACCGPTGPRILSTTSQMATATIATEAAVIAKVKAGRRASREVRKPLGREGDAGCTSAPGLAESWCRRVADSASPRANSTRSLRRGDVKKILSKRSRCCAESSPRTYASIRSLSALSICS
jgi:hypothetical protein